MVLLLWLIHGTNYFILVISFKKVPTIFFQRTKLQQSSGLVFVCFLFQVPAGQNLVQMLSILLLFRRDMFPQPIALMYRHSNINIGTHTCHSTGLIHNPILHDDKEKVCSAGDSADFLYMYHQNLAFKGKDNKHDRITAFLFEDFFLPLISWWEHLRVELQETQIPDYKDLEITFMGGCSLVMVKILKLKPMSTARV